jgi:hypothetical protein
MGIIVFLYVRNTTMKNLRKILLKIYIVEWPVEIQLIELSGGVYPGHGLILSGELSHPCV